MATAHVFVDDLSSPALDEADLHHLQRVLRLRDGETVTASDGQGGLVPCRWAGGRLDVDGEVVREERPRPVTVAFAPVKGDRPEWAVQKLTELGVDRIVALRCDRSVVRWDDGRAEKHLERWARIAREAAMQSRRLWLPEIDRVVRQPASLANLATSTTVPGTAESALPGTVLADRDADPLGDGVHTVLIGPEGGWSAEERAALPAVSLTGTVLRTETAAVAAGVVLCTVRDRAIGRGARSNLGF